jgi:hypothetical protein
MYASRSWPTRDLYAVVGRSEKLAEPVEQTAHYSRINAASPEFYFIFTPVFHIVGHVSEQ